MADGHHPTPPDDLHPTTKAKPRQTVLRRPTAPTRHTRPRASGVAVRQAVDSFLLARTDYRPSTCAEHSDILGRFAAFTGAHRWPSMTDLYDTGVRRGELLAMRVSDVEAVDRATSVVSGKSGTRAVGKAIVEP